MEKQKYTQQIKDEAKRLGFFDCGISKADYLAQHAPQLETYLKNGWHGKMDYMANNFDKRLDPRKLVEGAKSVVSLLYNYYPSSKQTNNDAPKLAKFAYGQDYHHIVKNKLKQLLEFINTNIGEVGGRFFVDSAPILDKAWAERSGLGWYGKNGNLIHPKAGSFFFVAELIIDLELAYGSPINEHCGNCTLCIDACPTNAITAAKKVDGSKCISYFTIELRDAIPTEMQGKFENWIFGCDICQDICPWNRKATPHNEPQFQPVTGLMDMSLADWQQLDQATFSRVFSKSAVKRTKLIGLQRNIAFLNLAPI